MNTGVIITSPANPRIKEIRKLREKKFRKYSGLYLVEGLRIVGEAVKFPDLLHTVIVAPELLTSAYGQELVKKLQRQPVELLWVSAEVFSSISEKDGPQGLAAVMRQRTISLPEREIDSSALYIALESVQDPGNLGSIIRTADAVSAQGVVLVGNRVDLYDPAVIRGSMGAFFSIPVIKTELSDLFAWCSRMDLQVIGTSDSASTHYAAVRYPWRVLVWMGSEQKGLSEDIQTRVNQMVRIPMAGCSDSLNLAVATGIVLYEIVNQRSGRNPMEVGT